MTPNLSATELKRLHRLWRRASDARVAILLDGVQGPYNVGALMRTAAAMQVTAFYAVGLDASWTDAKIQKTAMGSHRFLDLQLFPTVDSAACAVKDEGFCLVGLELATEAKPLWELDLRGDVCIAVGHEDRGLSPALMRLCDGVGYIPMLGRVGSLNVATAASIACYEARRQQLAAE